MIEIGLNKVEKSFGNKKVLKNISFEVKTNEKVALIGQNGSGKTTLLKLISKEDNPTSGEITIRKDATIAVLEQKPKVEWNNIIVKDILYSSFAKINELEKKLKVEEEKLSTATDKDLEKVIKRYTNLQEEFISLGGYEINSKVEKIIAGFKVEKLIDKKYATLSGGEKTIINLMVILLQEPDIMLLDEPTNHLDIDTLEWLENFLKNCKKTILIVSHDRYFLDKVVTKTILIDNGESEIFNGNYSYYLEENENRIMREFNEYKNQQKQIDAMKSSIKRLREYGKLAYPCGEKFFRRAASIEKRLEKIEVLDKPNEKKTIPLNFEFDKRSGNDVIELNRFNYSIGDKELFKNTNLFIKYQERVCLMGKNGSGKSTLIKEIINGNPKIKIGSNIEIGYIPQEIIFEDETITVLEEAHKYFNGPEDNLRSALYKFLFYGEGVFVRLNKLSGGERIRLKMFCLMQKKNNLLILDEPTNHIDINTKEILEEALNNYNGTILLISHDRYFINKVATRIVYLENKNIKSYVGNYDDYKNTLIRQNKISTN
ncbi:MAG: ABC-F family ATP-binding cassette domain-containing protein [Bacilli bacterium]|nr:ABC-F family ATP-binding cassette domain-containing protein [Bacilli bacterium]